MPFGVRPVGTCGRVRSPSRQSRSKRQTRRSRAFRIFGRGFLEGTLPRALRVTARAPPVHENRSHVGIPPADFSEKKSLRGGRLQQKKESGSIRGVARSVNAGESGNAFA